MKTGPQQSAILILALLICNEFIFAGFRGVPWVHAHFTPGGYHHSLVVAALRLTDLWLAISVVWMRRSDRLLDDLLRDSAAFNAVSAAFAFLLMLALNPLYAGQWQAVRLVFPLGVAYLAAKAFWLRFVRAGAAPVRPVVQRLATVGFAFVLIFLLLECVFLFVARSHHNNTALASRIWFARHWQVNSLGYRDDAPVPDTRKKKILLLGDSFVAGHGLTDTRDRLGERLPLELGPGFQVFNLGLNGAGPQEEFEALKSYPVKPDLVILGWYVNDIEPFVDDLQLPRDPLPCPVSLVHGSYLANYFYWSFPHGNGDYLARLKAAFADPKTRNDHEVALWRIRHFCYEAKVPMLVLLYPPLFAPDELKDEIDDQASFWHGFDVRAFEVKPLLSDTIADNIINASDPHPSARLNERMAKSLVSTIMHVLSRP